MLAVQHSGRVLAEDHEVLDVSLALQERGGSVKTASVDEIYGEIAG